MSEAVTDPNVSVVERRARLRGLYALTPDDDDTDRLARKVEAAIAGGARAIQYRNKTAPASLRQAQAARLAMLTSRANFVLSLPMLYCMVTGRLVG
jgi:thiamine-phosphate pyrophosphorylase